MANGVEIAQFVKLKIAKNYLHLQMAMLRFLVQPFTKENVLLGVAPDFSSTEAEQFLALRIPSGCRSLENVTQ